MNFISDYLEYTSGTEVPAIFNRWSCLSIIGSFLERDLSIQHGSNLIFPNMYIMLMGTPGTRKSTAIVRARHVLKAAGYKHVAADKSTKEKLLLDMAAQHCMDDVDALLWGDNENAVTPTAIMADEFNDFFGNNILEFVAFIGTLWDYSGVYSNRIKSGESVSVPNPTISLIGGNTPGTFANTFPPETIGQGFFSRLLLIHGEPNGKRIAFPPSRPESARTAIAASLKLLKPPAARTLQLTAEAKNCLTRIYAIDGLVVDGRLATYYTRRFTHLLKLCIIMCAARCGAEVSERDVIYANTTLYYAEQFMPRALGEFGKARSSGVADKVIAVLEANGGGPLTFRELWKAVHADLEQATDLGKILQNLLLAEKIVSIPETGAYFINRKKSAQSEMDEFLDYSILTPEELRLLHAKH